MAVTVFSLVLALVSVPAPSAGVPTVVAVPVLEGRARWSAAEPLEAYSERVGLRPFADGGAVGAARPDRPLLLPAKLVRGGEDDRQRLLGPLVEPFASLPLERLAGMVSGGCEVRLRDLPEEGRRAIASQFATLSQFRDGVPSSDNIGLSGSLQVLVRIPGSGYIGVMDQGGKPFDPGPYLDRLRFRDPFPVPASLAARLADRKAGASAEGVSSLAELVARLSTEGVQIDVDRRAQAWTVDVRLVSGSAPAVDVLAAAARAHRLYFRPLGNGWLLAASPGEPRRFAKNVERAARIEGAFPLLERIARAGLVSESGFALMAGGKRGLEALDASEARSLRALLKNGSRIKTSIADWDAFLTAASTSREGEILASFSLNVYLKGDGYNLGIGCMLP